MLPRHFYRTVWRINSVLILVAFFIVVCLLGLAFLQITNEFFGRRTVNHIINTADGEIQRERLTISTSERLTGSDYFLISLQSDQDYQQSYFSKTARAIRNYAFVSPSGATNWVYPHNRFLFTEAVALPSNKRCGVAETARGVLFVVRKEDTNDDRRLTYNDHGIIALARPDGDGFQEVLTDVLRLISSDVTGDILVLVYQSSEGGSIAYVSLEDFSVINQFTLAPPATVQAVNAGNQLSAGL